MPDLHQDHDEIESFTDIDEQVEQSKDGRNRRLLWASIGALSVTVVATVAVVFGANASNSELLANRNRQLMATYAGNLTLSQDSGIASYQEWLDARTQSYWQAHFLTTLSIATQDTALKAALSSMAQQATTTEKQIVRSQQDQSPSVAEPKGLGNCAGSLDPPHCATALTTSYEDEATRWLERERSYLAVVSMFAVSLFLFALTRSVDRPSMQRMFLFVATAIGAIAVAWLVAEAALIDVHQPSAQGAIAYGNGWSELGAPSNQVQGTLTKRSWSDAIAQLTRATKESPELADAWDALGTAQSENSGGNFLARNCASSIGDYQRAVSISDTPLGSVFEGDLANEELRCGDSAGAARTLTQAIESNDLNSAALETLAEEEMVAGRPGWYKDLLHAVFVAAYDNDPHQHVPLHGPYWRDLWFTSAREDESRLRQLGVPQSRLDDFFGLAMAAEGAFNAREMVGRFDNDSVHNAAITAISPQFGEPVSADKEGTLLYPGEATVDVGYSGLRQGEILTVSWYQRCTDPFSGCDYAPDSVPTMAFTVSADDGSVVSSQPHQGSGVLSLGPVFPEDAHYEIDVTLNNQAMAFEQVTVPVTTSNSS